MSDKASPLAFEGRNTPPGLSPPVSPKPTSRAQGPRIGYRTEYRHLHTKELIKDEISDAPQAHPSGIDDLDVVFEVVTTYLYVPNTNSKDNILPIHSDIEPTHSIRLHSPAIINALRAVVKYYPGQELEGDIIIKSPYCILVHHFDELLEYSKECTVIPPENLCMRDRHLGEHMKMLTQFLEETVMQGARAEMKRNAKGYFTFDHAWVLFKPGKTMVANLDNEKNWTRGVIKSVSKGTFETPPEPWFIEYWSLDYDGLYLSRRADDMGLTRFDGERALSWRNLRILDTSEVVESEDHVVKDLIKWGRTYCQLLDKQCMYHEGQSPRSPYHQIDGLIMTDAKKAASIEPPDYMMTTTNDLRQGAWRCSCTICQSTEANRDKSGFSAMFENYDKIASQDLESGEMTAHHFMLCPFEILVFVFKTRIWQRVHIKNLRDADFDETMVDKLIIDEKKKHTLTSLAKSFARRTKADGGMAKPMWSADFVVGKGAGLTFLLHGKPGVGKTLTAECIAAFTKRPLMTLSSSDIGTHPREVETNLSIHFQNAKSWGAVLLIDEADVFMERRTANDLQRNSLVAGFLRALEYYEGILFLTTNRVGSFDDAFVSRVHVQLYYPEFTDDQRQKVWQTFIDKLEKDRKGYMRLSYAAKEYIRESKKSDLKWNGREIRNAFQTAVSLAEYDAEKDEGGTILVTDQHLRAVVDLSKDFKDYLYDLHSGDEDKRAKLRAERLDSFKRDNY